MTQRKQFLSSESLSSLSTAQTLTIPPNCDYLELQPKTHDVWITFDGTTPSASNGITYQKDGIFAHYVHPNNIIKAKESAASGTLYINYFKINEAI